MLSLDRLESVMRKIGPDKVFALKTSKGYVDEGAPLSVWYDCCREIDPSIVPEAGNKYVSPLRGAFQYKGSDLEFRG